MKNITMLLVFILISVALSAGMDRPFSEDDMLLANMEEPIVDIQPNWATDSLNVRGVGLYPLFGDAYDVFIVDTLAYVCMDDNLVILNVKDQSYPILTGYCFLPITAYGVYVSGSYAYVADGSSGLQIINISNPASPTIAGSYNTIGTAIGVYVSGSYAYVADRENGLQIIDISNPASPTLAGSCNTPGYAEDVFVSGSYAYVADGGSGLQIINISNPASPTLSGNYDTYSAKGVYISGSYAYVADYGSLQILNISDPSSPTLTGSYDTPGNALGVYVSGSYAYVADDSSGLQIINISNPASPTLAGSYNTSGYARGVYVSGSYAYVADDTEGLQIINISNPATPTLAGSYDTPGTAYGVYVSGSYAYVAAVYGGLQIINISNPATPTLAGSYDTPGTAYGVYVSGSYAYVADDDSGLQIINISNPAAPTLAGSYNTTGNALGVYVSGSYAYVADDDYGLQIINISNPASPTIAGSCDTPGYALDVYISGSYAYVADGSSGLQIINISNPASPTLAGSYNTTGYAWDVYVSGSYAYVADYTEGLQIINISNPATPTLAGSYNTSGYARGVYVSGSYAYVADDSSGLQIINISNPASPTLAGSYDTPGYGYKVNIISNNVYLTNSSFLYIVEHLYSQAEYSQKTFNFYDTDIGCEYNWNDFYVENIGITDLIIDSITISNYSFVSDTFFEYPLIITVGESLNIPFMAFSSDTGLKTGNVKVHHNAASDKDSIVLQAHFGKPVRIDSAKAYDGANIVNGIDNDDYVILFFNQNTNGATLDAMNIDNVFDLSNGHSWLDGFGALGATTWNPAKSTLMINLTTSLALPTIAVGDTLFPDSSTIIGTLNGFRCHYPVQLKGAFGGEVDTTKPLAFNLIEPSGHITDNTPTYIWHKSGDLYFKNYELFVNGTLKTTLNDTIYTEAAPLADGMYNWYVAAVDSTGNRRNSNQTDTFEIDLTPPTAISLISPIDNSSVSSTVFTWHLGTDNYSGVKNYNLWYDDDSMFGSYDSIALTDTTYSASLTQGIYFWKVRAIDNFDNIGDWSSRWSFNYSLAGITDKFTLETKEKSNTELTVTMNHVRFAMMTSENEFTVYDITGKVVHSEVNSRTGKHNYSTEHLSSGIYFIRFKDGERDINRKMVIIR